jgi:hypothetical protein
MVTSRQLECNPGGLYLGRNLRDLPGKRRGIFPRSRKTTKNLQEMKTLRFLLASAAAAVIAGSASAATVVHITGSTAFRASVVAAIIDQLTSPTGAYIGSSISGANQAVITGTSKSHSGDGVITYELAWSGSISGLQSLTTTVTTLPGTTFAANQTWLSASGNTLSAVTVTTTNSGFTYAISGGTATTTGAATFDAFQGPDAAFSDTFITSTIYSKFASNLLSFTSGGMAPSCVGVIPFAWAKGPQGSGVTSGNWNGLTNMTADLASNLLLDGAVPLSMFTGNSADAGVDVVLSGRNNDSGTRFSAVAEAGLAEGAGITQYGFTTNSSSIDSFGFTPALSNGDVGDPYNSTDGQSSGGTLAGWVKLPPDANSINTEPNNLPFIVVAYLGVSDASTVALAGGTTLSFNGTPANIVFNNALDIFNGNTNTFNGATNTSGSEATLIQQGKYAFWEFEHFYYEKNLASAQVNAIGDVHNQIATVDALAAGMFGTLTSGMQVSRTSEFTPPFGFNP